MTFSLRTAQQAALDNLKNNIPALKKGQFAGAGGDIDVGAMVKGALFLENLGTPAVADVDRYVVSVDMQTTAYTLANTGPGTGEPPRNVTATHTTVVTTDTLGSVVIIGTDVNDVVISETVALSADAAVVTVKAFKTITSIVTADWVQAGGTSDTIVVGMGDLLGISRELEATTQVAVAMLGAAVVIPDAIAIEADDAAQNTVDMSGATYDGTKEARVLVSL